MTNLFLNELTKQFDRLLDAKSKLDNKSVSMITISGVVSTLLMGFGVFLLRSVNPQFTLYFWMFLVLVIGILLVIITIGLSIWSYRLRDQVYPTGSDMYFSGNNLNWKEINPMRNATDNDFELRMIVDYLDCLKDVETHIDEKGKFVKISQWTFLSGVITIPIIITMLLSAVYYNMLEIKPIL